MDILVAGKNLHSQLFKKELEIINSLPLNNYICARKY